MDIALEKKNSKEGTINVTLKPEDYEPQVNSKIKEYRKKAQIKGFRPGKVPAQVIKKMYGKAILAEEINEILQKALPEYIQKEKINLVGDPLPREDNTENIDWNNQTEFTFQYDVGFVENIPVDQIKESGPVERLEIEISDDVVNETIQNLQNQFSENTNPEVSEDGDILRGKLTSVDGETEIDPAILDLSFLKEDARNPFIGVKPGEAIKFVPKESFDVESKFAAFMNLSPEEANEHTGEFIFTVSEINRQVPHEVNEELFKKSFPDEEEIKDEETFRSKIAEKVKENYDQETENLLFRDIREHVLNQLAVDMPRDFLKRWLLSSNEESMSEEELENEFENYVKEMKWNLISRKIVEDNEINVDNEEVLAKAKETVIAQLGQYGLLQQLGDNLDSFVMNYLQAENGKHYMQTYNMVRTDKVIEHVKGLVEIKTKKVSRDAFVEYVNNIEA
mgnify:CR=1 FL=1